MTQLNGWLAGLVSLALSGAFCAAAEFDAGDAPVVGTADFTRVAAPLNKRLHSSSFIPDYSIQNLFDFTPILKELHFDSVRTHDWPLCNPGMRIIDTHFIFPLQDKDPADPANYFFDATDEVLRQVLQTGTKVLYRLGTSIEHNKYAHFNTQMPKDFHHYAEILAGIVRHYTRGWANGHHWNIQYWEIWNEPELGPNTWTGSYEEFTKFFAIVLKRLKSEFPDLKIGGPALCSFNEKQVGMLMDECDRLDVVPDFFSWHCYNSDPKLLINYPRIARKWFDQRSPKYRNIELNLNEWHYLKSWDFVNPMTEQNDFLKSMDAPDSMYGIDSAAFNLYVLAGWQDTPMNLAHYYGLNREIWGFLTVHYSFNKNFYSMKMHAIAMEYDSRAEASVQDESFALLPVLKDANGDACLLVSDYRGTRNSFRIDVKGLQGYQAKAIVLDHEHDLTPHHVDWDGNQIHIRKNLPGSAAFLILFQR